MSETPETNAVCEECSVYASSAFLQMRDHARKLERERDLLRLQVEALAGKIAGLGCVSSTFGGYHKDWEELTLSEQAGYWITWSIKQAKGGGGEC